jgi:hypothetical protein
MNSSNRTSVNDLYRSIGELVVRWVMIEQNIDMTVAIVYRHCGGKALEKEIPRSLDKKLQFLKKAFARVATLAPKRNEVRDLIQRIKAESSYRHDLVHSRFSETEFYDGKFQLVKFDYEPEMHYVRLHVFDLKTFPEHSALALRLATEMHQIADWLVGTFVRPLHTPAPHP